MLWAGYTEEHGGKPEELFVMDWDTLEWSRSDRKRLGKDEKADEILMVMGTVIKSDYFKNLDCINARWPQCQKQSTENPCFKYNTDYLGDDIDYDTKTDTAELCFAHCQALDDCNYWTWEVNSGVCHRKGILGEVNQLDGLVSGPRLCGKVYILLYISKCHIRKFFCHL